MTVGRQSNNKSTVAIKCPCKVLQILQTPNCLRFKECIFLGKRTTNLYCLFVCSKKCLLLLLFGRHWINLTVVGLNLRFFLPHIYVSAPPKLVYLLPLFQPFLKTKNNFNILVQ